ncbi:DNA adenine methylase [Vibrio breoganii]
MNDIKVGLSPLLRWVGGKSWISDVITAIYRHNGGGYYVEPFAGGLSCALTALPENALINDINADLINLYEVIKDGAQFDFGKYASADYYALRDRFNVVRKSGNPEDRYERAELFFVLNKLGYNGLIRYSTRYNVPKGDKELGVCADMATYASFFADWKFESVDFECLEIPSNSFVVIDSPYHDKFTRYWETDFEESDQERCIQWAGSLQSKVILTNAATPYVISLLEKYGFSFVVLQKKYSVAAKAKGRKARVQEVFAWKGVELSSEIKRMLKA